MASPPVLEDPHHASRRAKTRIGVAVVLLAVAIGGLALLSRHKPENQLPGTEDPLSQKQESVSSGENQPLPAEAPVEINSAQQEPPLAPVAETPTEPPPPPPAPLSNQLPVVPSNSAAPATPRSVTAAAMANTAEPVVAAAAQPVAIEKPYAAKPAATLIKAEPAPASAPRAFVVQVGVFTDMDNARQLQTRLTEHGIPSHTETKLQIGPFHSKAEADAAQGKLRALGMGAVIVPIK